MKAAGVAALRRFGVVAALRAAQRSRAVVLAYHGVLQRDGDPFLDANFIPADLFDEQLRHLCRHYQPIALRELVQSYRDGIAPPPRSVVVTFDDGFANNFTVAYPILRRHRVPFTVFLTTALVDGSMTQLWTERVKRAVYLFRDRALTLRLLDRSTTYQLTSRSARAAAARDVVLRLKRVPPARRDGELQALEAVCGRPAITAAERERYDALSWDQVREMAAAGVEFGSHTVSHPILTTVDADALRSELTVSKQRIEAELDRECYAFAYPNGSPADFGDRECAALNDAGYGCGLSLLSTVNQRRPDPYRIDRINVVRDMTAPLFVVAATGMLGQARRARRLLHDVRHGSREAALAGRTW